MEKKMMEQNIKALHSLKGLIFPQTPTDQKSVKNNKENK